MYTVLHVLCCLLLVGLTAVQPWGSALLCVFVSDWCVKCFKAPSLGFCEEPVGGDEERSKGAERETTNLDSLFFSPAPSRDTRSAPPANEAITDTIIMRPLPMQTAPYYVPNTQTIPSMEAN